MRHATSIAFVAASIALAAPAHASPRYPADLESDLALSYQPPCSLCHLNGVTGYGTVNTPFGKNMRARGLVAEDPAALSAALMKLEADKVDSDGDTVLDVDELALGTDPNTPDKGAAPSQIGPSIAYGCGARVAPGEGGSPFGAIAIAAAIAVIAARRGQLSSRTAR